MAPSLCAFRPTRPVGATGVLPKGLVRDLPMHFAALVANRNAQDRFFFFDILPINFSGGGGFGLR